MATHRMQQSGRPPARSGLLLWGAGAVAAVLLVLSTSGTLSSWTSAIIANDTNTVATASAVILKEVGPSATCLSSSGAANSYTCSTVNKYGGTSSPLVPGGSQTTDVVFSNVGASPASSFVLATAACSQSPVAGSGSPAAANLCANGDLTVAFSCSNGATYSAGSAWTDLVQTAVAPSSIPATLTHTATLAAGSSFTCRFTVALGAAASVLDQGITASQALTWTLNQ